VTTIFLIRHAETDAVGKWIAGWTPGVHLNPVGVTQAHALAECWKLPPLSAVYSSPLERALETAAPLAARWNLEITPRESLGEIHYGEWTGGSFVELEHDRRWRLFNVRRTAQPVPGGESILQVQARIVAELACLASLHPDEPVAAISHGDVIRAAVAYYLGISLDFLPRFEIAPASVTTLRFEPDAVVLTSLNNSVA
jgi:broad specificity phosphatase PhoE